MLLEMADPLFSLLDTKPAFDLDMKKLEASYFQKQRLFHPDRFIGKPPAERAAAMQKSVDINEAYHALKNPLSRAQALLRGQGVVVGTDNDTVKPGQELLMETMEWREAIDEAATPEALKTLKNRLEDTVLRCLSDISSLYRGQDWPAMAQATLRLGYLEKSLEAVGKKAKRSA